MTFERAAAYDTELDRGLKWSGFKKTHFAAERIRALSSLLPAEPRVRRILDFGCGIGDTVALLAERFPNALVTGVDSEAAAIAEARRRHPALGAAFFASLELAGVEPFDLIYLNGVLHHVPIQARVELLSSLASRLAPGGRLALFENNPRHPGTRWVMSRIPFDRDALPLSPREARRLLEASGFVLAELRARYYFWFPRPLAPLEAIARRFDRLPLGTQYLWLGRPREAGERR